MKPSEAGIGDALIALLADRISVYTGLHFAGPRLDDLRAALPAMTSDAGLRHEADCVGWLLARPWTDAKTALCAKHLTVGETYFFREPHALELIGDYAAARLGTAGVTTPAVRIWSAGCCSGEEPYSIAMALLDRCGTLDPAQVDILGTDISRPRLEAARAGVYRPWSLRGTPEAVRERYFQQLPTGEFEVAETVRGLVRFDELNLAAEDFPDDLDKVQRFDVIFCRNVLMYFSREQAQQVIARLRNCLIDGGWLVVNPAEASAELYAGFQATYFPEGIYFRKTEANAAGEDHPQRKAHSIAAARVPQPSRSTPPAHSPADKGVDYLQTALRAIEAGDTQDALVALKAEIYLRPDTLLAHYWLGVVQLGQHQTDAATRQFKTVSGYLTSMPDHAVVPGSGTFTAGYLRAAVASFLKRAEESRAEIV